MKLVNESTIYRAILKDKQAELDSAKRALLSGGMKDLKLLLSHKFEEIRKSKSGKLTELALNEVARGNIIIFVAKDATKGMPSYMPFIKFKTSTLKFIFFPFIVNFFNNVFNFVYILNSIIKIKFQKWNFSNV